MRIVLSDVSGIDFDALSVYSFVGVMADSAYSFVFDSAYSFVFDSAYSFVFDSAYSFVFDSAYSFVFDSAYSFVQAEHDDILAKTRKAFVTVVTELFLHSEWVKIPAATKPQDIRVLGCMRHGVLSGKRRPSHVGVHHTLS